MEKDEWYRNRILWRAQQHKLFDKKCFRYSELPEEKANVIKKATGEIKPVIVFWENEFKWTVLGVKAIYSFYDNNLVFAELDAINKQLSVYQPVDMLSNNVKLESSFIKLDSLKKQIWAPPGQELFALMNILLMFPMAVQSNNSSDNKIR